MISGRHTPNRDQRGPQPALVAATGLVTTVLLLLITSAAARAGQNSERYKGREIADVMTFHGAPWLERDSRIQEEDPEALLALLPIEAGDTVVDMGCGSGYYARRMAQRVGPEGRVLCVDIQPEMLEIARRLAERDGVTNMEFVRGEINDPKLEPGTIDLILLVDVYHEFADPAPMLAAMRAALSDDGVAALAEYRLEGDTAAWIKLDHRMSADQVNKEWLPAGFQLRKLHETLPSQHLFLFERDQ